MQGQRQQSNPMLGLAFARIHAPTVSQHKHTQTYTNIHTRMHTRLRRSERSLATAVKKFNQYVQGWTHAHTHRDTHTHTHAHKLTHKKNTTPQCMHTVYPIPSGASLASGVPTPREVKEVVVSSLTAIKQEPVAYSNLLVSERGRRHRPGYRYILVALTKSTPASPS